MRPFISLCMIVKNEEKVLDRCLKSVVHLVNEIIVVDTGSTDSTKELLAKYPVRVYNYEWQSDFSKARNYAASKATGEWILVMDADEYVEEENFKEFIQEIKQDKEHGDAYTAKIINFTGNFGENLLQNFHDRIYKNNGSISYYRKIHEQFKTINGDPLRSKNSHLVIFHSGYLKQTVDEKSKNNRNKDLLVEEINIGGNKAFDYFNMGNEYCSVGDYSKALESYLTAYKLKKDYRLMWVSTTLIQIIICLINLKRYDDALNVINDAENIYSESPEIPYLKGEVFLMRHQYEDAKMMYLQIVGTNQYTHIIIRPDLKDQKPHLRLGEIYLLQENYHEAIFHYVSVVNIDKYNLESIKKIIYILNKFHTNDEIVNFILSKDLINYKNIKDYVNACFEEGNILLAQELIREFPKDNGILNKIAQLKLLGLTREVDAINFNELTKKEIKYIYDSKMLNIVDIVLLKEVLEEENIFTYLLEPYYNNKDFLTLLSLLNGEKSLYNAGEIFIYALKQFLIYKNNLKSTSLLKNIKSIDNAFHPKVADLLFTYNFNVEASNIYNSMDWTYLNEKDFLNIINNLLNLKDISNAVEISKYALVIYNNDFRFYDVILKKSDDKELIMKTLSDAKTKFKNSIYLANY